MIFDCETDGLLDTSTKIHVLGYTTNGRDYKTVTHYDDMREALTGDAHWMVCHNAIRFDVRVFRKILGIDIEDRVIDTLPLSWYLYPQRQKHGLEVWGEELGVAKPKVTDWSTQPIEVYENRVTEDVKINFLLWMKIIKNLKELYPESEKREEFLKYLMFKMKCAAEQEDVGWHVDLERVERNLEELRHIQAIKKDELRPLMPEVPEYATRKPPAKPRKADGTLSSQGMKWIELCDEHGLPYDHDEPIKVIKDYKEANPGAPQQVKDWLFSLGWKPCTYKYVKEDDGTERKIPQVRDKGELTPSVLRLAEKHEAVKVLEGLSVAQHRYNIFKNFKEFAVDGKLMAQVDGLTNTLRFKHKNPLVNLPGVDKAFGEEIRGSLIAPPGEILCGADMSSLESCTKRHYMWPYDPDYVTEMSQPGFDEHLDLAVVAGYINKDDYDFYARSEGGTVNDKDRFKEIKSIRTMFKPVNYGSVYGIQALSLSRQLGITKAKAQALLDVYWKRNWSVRELVKPLKTKKAVGGQRWMLNPVNGFWYSLRFDKDKFSTLNQGTGVYCFDTWLAYARAMGVVTCGQFHDEYIGPIKPEQQEENTKILKKAIGMVNKKLKLNVDLDVGIQYGTDYSMIH